MKKFTPTHLKPATTTKPSRQQSPDPKSGNSIRPTKSPENIQYIIGDRGRETTPIKIDQLSKSQQNTAAPKYFANNRSADQNKTSGRYPSYNQDYSHIHSHLESSHYHCIHAANSTEVVSELKKVINLIGAQNISQFDPQSNDISKQVQILNQQNLRLLELVSKLKQKKQLKSSTIQENYENEINMLRRQLETQQKQYQLKHEELYRTNKTLSSQVKSLEDRNINLEKEVDQLRANIRQKQYAEGIKIQELGRKNNQQKLSLSMIKQQYNESMRVMKNNLAYEVQNKLNEYQAQIRQYKLRIDTLQNRLKNCQKVNDINRNLEFQNKKLTKQLGQRESPEHNGMKEEIMKLQKQNREKGDLIAILNKQLSQTKLYYQNLVTELKVKNQNDLNQTSIQVQRLKQNYEKQIKILKNSTKSCNHGGIEQQNNDLKDLAQKYWQEIITLRNQLANSTSDKNKLEARIYNLEAEISKLKHQINNDHLKFTAQTTLLESENERLKKEIENKNNELKIIPELEEEINRLRKDSQDKTNIDILAIQNQKLHNQIKYQIQKSMKLAQDKQYILGQFNALQNQYNKMELQFKCTKVKQVEDLNRLDQLQAKNRQLANQLIDLKSQYDHLEYNLKNAHYDESKAKDHRIYQLELTIRNLSNINEDYQNQINNLKEDNKKSHEEKEELTQQISILRVSNEKNLRKNSEQWELQIEELKANHEKQISMLNSSLLKEKEINENTIMEMASKVTRFKGESLKKQLQELRQLINEGKFQRLQEELVQISQNYERELIRSQQKTMEINNLTNQKNSLLERISQLQKLRLILQQKINILSGNIKIIENELKQRKTQSQSLLNQKIILQKQNLMLKKIKLDRETIQATKARARQISLKIDRLLAMEEQREQNLIQVTKVYNQVIVQPASKKI